MKKKIPESLSFELEKSAKDFICFVTPETNKKLKKWLKDKYEDYDFRELDFIEENTIYTISKQPRPEITFGTLIPSSPPLYEGIIENGELKIRQSGGLAFHATLFAIPKEKVPETVWKEMSENEYRGLRDVAFIQKFINEKLTNF